MLLGRLRIWAKLAMLSVLPVLAIVTLTIPVVLDRAKQASRAAQTARAVRVAATVGSLVQDLQQERLLAVGMLLGTVQRSTLTLRITANTDRGADIPRDLGADLSEPVHAAIDDVSTLTGLRQAVMAHTATTAGVMSGYGQVITGILDSLRLLADLDTATAEGRQVVALDALLTADEATAAEATALAILAHDNSDEALAIINASQVQVRSALTRVGAMATTSQLALRQLVSQAFGERFGLRVESDPRAAIAGKTTETIFPAITSFITLGNFVEKRIVADVTTTVDQRRTAALATAYSVGTLAVLVVLVVLLLGVAIAGTVTRPLARLTMSAERVAQVAEAELVRVADEETDHSEPIHLDSLDIGGRDEIGDLARAFDRVQRTATQLVERQVASRRNIAQMFGHIGRRTHNLVSRQVALIDDLERAEPDPGRLGQLYRLDHVSNRLLRNASSLVVLSGADRVDEHLGPVPLREAVGLALGQIEDYERVEVLVPEEIALAPGVVTDLTLVIAELMENATMFSPPTIPVTVTAEYLPDGVRLTVVDHGIGMPEERMAEENRRLTMRERLDLTPTRVLGLFVVGRLARRHRLTVGLLPTVGGGVTAIVGIGRHLLVGAHPAASVEYQAGVPVGYQVPAEAGYPTAPQGYQPAGGEPPGDDEMGLDAARRIDELLATAPSWDAFAAARRAADQPGDPGEPEESPGTPAMPPGTAAMPPGTPAMPPGTAAVPPGDSTDPAGDPTGAQPSPLPSRVSPSGLRQRIPGTHHPTGGSVSFAEARPPTESDADAVRDLVDQFSLGVTRALTDFDAATADQHQPGEGRGSTR